MWLQHAIDLDNDIRRLALDDEDLRPVAGLDGAGFAAIMPEPGKVRKRRFAISPDHNKLNQVRAN